MNQKIIRLGVSGLVACSILGIRAQQINPVTEAVLQNYAEILAENPKDYMTLFDRASQYADMKDYVRALSDIDMALEYTPENDRDYREAEYSLKSDILTATKDYAGAISAINNALAINPGSQPYLYKAGNLYLLTDKPEDALRIFQNLQRNNPRSQEAFYGMAKANVMMGKNDEAVSLIQQVENLGKQSFVTYCRIGDLYADMGKIADATNNYVIAYTMTDDSQRPVESLKFISKKNPDAVMNKLEEIMGANPDNITLNYVKAILAFDAGMYSKAEKACKDLAAGLEEDSPAIYRMMAMSQLAQGKCDEATQSILTAQKLAPGNAGVLVDKADILLCQNPSESLAAAEEALAVNGNNEAAMLIGAKAAILSADYNKALSLLNNVVLGDPSNAEALLLRGYLNAELIKDEAAGTADYTRAGNIRQSGNVSDMVFAALAKSRTGKKLDAEGLISQAAEAAAGNKDDLYLVAVYYAQTGNRDKAKEYVDKAMLAGYGNIYNLTINREPLINLVPVHDILK